MIKKRENKSPPTPSVLTTLILKFVWWVFIHHRLAVAKVIIPGVNKHSFRVVVLVTFIDTDEAEDGVHQKEA